MIHVVTGVRRADGVKILKDGLEDETTVRELPDSMLALRLSIFALTVSSLEDNPLRALLLGLDRSAAIYAYFDELKREALTRGWRARACQYGKGDVLVEEVAFSDDSCPYDWTTEDGDHHYCMLERNHLGPHQCGCSK